jgi:hypothetical protein
MREANQQTTTPTPTVRRLKGGPRNVDANGVAPPPAPYPKQVDGTMREANSKTTTPIPAPQNRRALSPAKGSNVFALPKRFTGDEAIVAEVMARSEQQNETLLQHMRELTVLLQAQHRKKANELLPIALRMDRQTLDNFIEVGRRMVGARAGQ